MFRSLLPLIAVVAVVFAACADSSVEDTTTVTAVPSTSTTTVAQSSSTTGSDAGTTTTSTPVTTTSTTTSTTVKPTTEDPASRVIAVEIANGSVVVGEEEYEVARDAIVEIVVTSDVSDEVHVHGYDEVAEVAPGEPAMITFAATIPGIFEVELEGFGLLLFELVVS